MAVVGITVRVKDGRPILRGVVLDSASNTDIRTFTHLAQRGSDTTDQIYQLGNSVATELRGVEVEAAVVREADDAARGGLTVGRRGRARSEGVAVAALRELTTRVRIMNGPQVGRAFGADLATCETAASELVPADFIEAGTAALAARSLLG